MTLFINDTATTEIYTLSLHDALPIFPRTRALAPLEFAVRGAGATPPRRDAVPVHADAHRAARLAPLESRLSQHAVEALLLRLSLHPAGPGHHQRPHARRHPPPARDGRGLALVLAAAIRAGAAE